MTRSAKTYLSPSPPLPPSRPLSHAYAASDILRTWMIPAMWATWLRALSAGKQPILTGFLSQLQGRHELTLVASSPGVRRPAPGSRH